MLFAERANEFDLRGLLNPVFVLLDLVSFIEEVVLFISFWKTTW